MAAGLLPHTMGLLSRLATACFIVAIPLLLVTANVRFLAGDLRFYKHGFRSYDAAQSTGIALPELDRAAREIIDYFENDASTLRIIVSQDGQEVSLFNARETEHMKDVKTLMRAVYRVNEISLAYVLIYVTAVFLWSTEKPLESLARRALIGVGAGFAAVLFVGVFALTGFNSAWTRFHEIVFRNDLWKLNPDTDHLIQMFPEGFWREATYIVGGLTLIEATLIVVVAAVTLYLRREPARQVQERPGARAADPRPAGQ
jgi:integral membrane protein (TIGR01906 family)